MRENLFNDIENLSKFFHFKKRKLKEKIFKDIDFLLLDIEKLKNAISNRNTELKNLELNSKEEIKTLTIDLNQKQIEINNLINYKKSAENKNKELNTLLNHKNDKFNLLDKHYKEEKERNYQITALNGKLQNALDTNQKELIRKKNYIATLENKFEELKTSTISQKEKINELTQFLNQEKQETKQLKEIMLKVKNNIESNQKELINKNKDVTQIKKDFEELKTCVISQKEKINVLTQFLNQEKEDAKQFQEMVGKLKKELELVEDFRNYVNEFIESGLITDADELKKLEDLKYLLEDIEENELVELEEESFLEKIYNSFDEIVSNIKYMPEQVDEIEKTLKLDGDSNIEKIEESFSLSIELLKELIDLKIGKNKDEILENIKDYKRDSEYLKALKSFDKKKLDEFIDFIKFSDSILEAKDVYEAVQIIKEIYKIIDNLDYNEFEEYEQKVSQMTKDLNEIFILMKEHRLVSQLLAKDKISFNEIEEKFELLEELLISYSDKNMLKKAEELKEKIINYKKFPFNNLFKIGIGGGFASGKTQFMQQIVGNNIQLPIADTPTTAVATYFYNNNKLSIKSYNIFETFVEFSLKDYEMLNDHTKLKNLNVNYFLKFFIIENKIKYNNLCFIDVPGYNPSETSSTKEDSNIASKFLKESDIVFWCTSIERGTLEKEDIKFLKKLNKKIYVIINKADLKGDKERKEIFQQVKKVLNENDLDYIGISLFNSMKMQELGYNKISLLQYLDKLNRENQRKDLKHDIDRFFNEIFNSLNEKKKEIEKLNRRLKNIDLFVYRYLFDEKDKREQIEEEIAYIQSIYKVKSKKYDEIQQKIENIKIDLLK